MKKVILMLTAVVAMLATSCVQDVTEDVQVTGAEGVVNFTVQAPELGSRTLIGNGQKAEKLVYAVYDAQWVYLTEGTADFDDQLKANVSLRLVNNKEYNFVFWASVEGNSYYTLDTTTAEVTVSYAGKANDENRDAFFGQLTGLVVNGTMNESVKLYRPFAQVNWGTNDVAEAKTGGFDVTKGAGATVVYETEAYTKLSLKDGSVDGLTAVTFTAEDLVSNTYVDENGADELLVTKAGGIYTWVAMNYILWTADRGTLTSNKITVTDGDGETVVVNYPNANVQRNWRTNLVGSLLTDQTNIVVEILPGFDGEYSNEAFLAWATQNGGSFKLLGDLAVTSNPQGFTVDKDLNIDLNGHTLTLPNTTEGARARLFTVTGNANLTITNGSIVIESTNGMVDGTNASTGGSSVVYSESTGKVTLEDVNLTGSQRGGHRVIDLFAGEAEVTDCNIDVNYGAGVVVGENSKGTINNSNITVNGMYSQVWNSVCFGVWGGGELTINGGNYTLNNNDTYATGASHGGWVGIIMNSGGTITINDGAFENVPAAGFMPQYERAVLHSEAANGSIATYNIIGGKYNPQEDLIIDGYDDGVGKRYTNIAGNGTIADSDNDGWYTIEDNKGYVVNGTEYLVSTGAGLAAAVTDAPATATMKLTADVDLTGVAYTPRSFSKLVFDGQGHTISGVVVENANQAALFGKTWDFDIKDVTLANSTFVGQNIDGEDAAAAFVGFYQSFSGASCKLTNCHVEGCTIGSAKYVGGLVAYKNGTSSTLTFENCSVKGSTIVSQYTEDGGASYKGHAGGLVGLVDTASISGCVVEGNTFNVAGPRCGLFIGSAQADSPVSGEATGNTGLTQLCGAINNITDWSNVNVAYKVKTAAELQAFIANTAVGEVKNVALAAGTYNGLFNVNGKKTINISSTEGAVIDGLVNGMDWATISLKGLTLQNTNNVGTDIANRDDQKGACVGAYVANITIEKCTLNLLQDRGGIYIDSDRTDGWAADWDGYNLRVKECVFNCAGKRPIQCRPNVLIDGCTFNDQYRYSVQIRFNPQDASEKVTFTNNKIVNPCVSSGKGFCAGITIKTSDEVKDVVFDIAGNTLESSLFSELLYVYDDGNVANLHLDTCTIPSDITFVPEP